MVIVGEDKDGVYLGNLLGWYVLFFGFIYSSKFCIIVYLINNIWVWKLFMLSYFIFYRICKCVEVSVYMG